MNTNNRLVDLRLILALICYCLLQVWMTSPAEALTVRYSYDQLNRLTEVTYDNGVRIEYAYDSAGNRTWMRIAVPGGIGDINGDGIVDLQDAIIILQALSGKDISNLQLTADVNADGKLGLPEVVYILQKVSE